MNARRPQTGPYRPPKARVELTEHDEVVERPNGLLITAIVTASITLNVAAIAPGTLRSYQKLYDAFGPGLPTATQVTIGIPHIWWIFALLAISIAAWVAMRRVVTATELRRMKLVTRLFAVVFGLAVAFALYAIYLPVFKLGAIV